MWGEGEVGQGGRGRWVGGRTQTFWVGQVGGCAPAIHARASASLHLPEPAVNVQNKLPHHQRPLTWWCQR